MSFFNNNLPYIRKQKGISQKDLAKKIGVDQSTISLWEKGMDTTVENVIKVAEALNVPVPDFIGSDLRFDNAELINLNIERVKIPVLGTIKAGKPIEAQENIVDYVEIPKDWIKQNKNYYGLKINGNSMSPKYMPNDTVIFEQTNDFQYANNKDCCVMVNGDDATFKVFKIKEDGIRLIPLNIENDDGYLPTSYTKEEIENLPVKVIGIARVKISIISYTEE